MILRRRIGTSLAIAGACIVALDCRFDLGQQRAGVEVQIHRVFQFRVGHIYLTFSVARPIIARISEMIQKRITICGSAQPFFS